MNTEAMLAKLNEIEGYSVMELQGRAGIIFNQDLIGDGATKILRYIVVEMFRAGLE